MRTSTYPQILRPALRLHRLSYASFANFLVAFSLSSSLVSVCSRPALAVTGFTGSFLLNNESSSTWNFSAPEELELITSVDCDNVWNFSSSCLDYSEASSGRIQVIAGVAPGQTELTWPKNPPNNSSYYVSFNITCIDCDLDPNISVAYSVGGISGANGVLNAANLSDPVSAYLAPSTGISFTFTNTDYIEGLRVNITDFNAVPGPLPATGAAAAFGYSRRLRRRIRGVPGSGSRRKSRPPAQPSAYLDLAPGALHTLPLSFRYPAATELRVVGTKASLTRLGGALQHGTGRPAALSPMTLCSGASPRRSS